MNTEIIKILNKGGIGVIPTDTIYGLVGGALNKKAVERIYKVRERNKKKPLIVLVSSINDLNQFGIDLKSTRGVLGQIWPGKISVILPLPRVTLRKFKYLHRGTKKLAFRLPKHEKLIEILRKTGPLVAPSANTEGNPPAKNTSVAKKYFGDKVDFYEGGGTILGNGSTVIEWDGKGFILVREGAVSRDRLKKKKLLK